MDLTNHIVLTDDFYKQCNDILSHGQRFVMFSDKDHNRIKVVLINGFIMGEKDGQLAPVINETTSKDMNEAKPDENHIQINKQSLKVSKKEAHANLDNLTTLAHEKGFPLYCVEFSSMPGVIDTHILGVTLEKL